MTAGRLASCNRWPVKSMAGETVAALCLDRLGAAGDRTHAIFDVFKGSPRRVNAKTSPRLLAWTARYADIDAEGLARDDPPLPVITSPAGATLRWDDPALPAALADDLGRAVSLAREPRGLQDRPATVHITVEASLRALEEALGEPIDLRRFRTNLHLDLDAAPFEEERWSGRRVRIGAAELEIVAGCERCAIPTRDPDTQRKWPELLRWLAAEHQMAFGIIARARSAAVVRCGDRVSLLP